MAYKLLQAAVCSTLLIEVLGAPFLMEDPANQFLRLKRQVVHLQDFWDPDHHQDGKGTSLADEMACIQRVHVYSCGSGGREKNSEFLVLVSESWVMEAIFKNTKFSQAVVEHAFNPSTWEAEAGGFLSSRPAWSTE
ncbi:uncharacterized protein C3orf85 homolog [Arvicanthis niloticus]|uniref:uncharacterized protein C3orf85 homolog n=1 Tax=Arvicanthis niloticus TaxID=61156 RepID=UPI00402B3B53